MLLYPTLECRKHICKRIAEAVSSYLQLNCDKLDAKLQLHHTITNGSSSVGFQIPVNVLRALNVSDIHKILFMNSDSVIKGVTKNCNDGQENIIFVIEKNELLNSVLKTSLTPKQQKCTPKNNVMIEFSSPNIAKPFHMGHLRSTIIGNFIANIMELSTNVKRLNYLGDWGTHIGYVKIGLDSKNIPDVIFLENPMKQLYKAYSFAYNKGDMLNKAKEIFAQLESNSSEWTGQWEKIRSITIEHLMKTYNSLGIVFDEYLYESKYRAENISHVIDFMKSHGLICLDKNCLVTHFVKAALKFGSGYVIMRGFINEDKTGKLFHIKWSINSDSFEKAMEMDGLKIPLLKNDGTTLYLVRDIASALDRLNNYDCDTLMYVVDKSQSEHLNRLKFAISTLVKKNIIHVPFGRVTGMSTRKGTSIFLADILNETVKIMADQQLNSPNTRSSDPEVTRVLGMSCLMVYVLRHRRNRDFQFSWETALQASGDTGSKLQYTHCRLCSLEKNCGVFLPKEVNATVLIEPIASELIFELARFQDILYSTQNELESSILISYSFKLCNTVSRCLKILPVKGQPLDVAEQRLLLFHTAKNFLCSSMKLLGLQPLDEM